MTQNLLQRGHTWYVRYVIPRASRLKLGKESISRSLKTRDLDEARKRRPAVLAEIIAEVDLIVDAEKYSKASMIEEAAAVAEEIRSAPTNEKADLATYVASDRAMYFHEKKGYEAGQVYADIALRGSMPISSAGKQYLESIEGKVSQGTIDGRKRSINTFIQSMGDGPIANVSPRMTASWLTDHLAPSGKAPKTLAKYIDNLNLLWKWSFRREWCAGTSPFMSLKSEIPKAEKHKRGFSDGALKGFLGYLRGLPSAKRVQYEVALLLVYSGARLGDICELQVRSVKSEDGEVHIFNGKSQAAERVLFFHNPECLGILNQRCEGKEPTDQLFHELKRGGEDNRLSHGLSNRMRYSLEKFMPDAKAQGIDIHSIRRWAGTVFDNTPEIHPELADRMVGHKTGRLLSDVYSDGPEKVRLREGFRIFDEKVEARIFL